MKCRICSSEAQDIRHYIWVEEDGWRPFMDAKLFVEWLSKSASKHRKISAENAKNEYKKAIFSGNPGILAIIQAKNPRVTEWKIIYDYACSECQKVAHISKT